MILFISYALSSTNSSLLRIPEMASESWRDELAVGHYVDSLDTQHEWHKAEIIDTRAGEVLISYIECKFPCCIISHVAVRQGTLLLSLLPPLSPSKWG